MRSNRSVRLEIVRRPEPIRCASCDTSSVPKERTREKPLNFSILWGEHICSHCEDVFEPLIVKLLDDPEQEPPLPTQKRATVYFVEYPPRKDEDEGAMRYFVTKPSARAVFTKAKRHVRYTREDFRSLTVRWGYVEYDLNRRGLAEAMTQAGRSEDRAILGEWTYGKK